MAVTESQRERELIRVLHAAATTTVGIASLETITPEGAEEAEETLTGALHERTETIEQAIEAGRFTRTAFDHITEAGEKIDEAFAQLRNQGFLPEPDEHEGA